MAEKTVKDLQLQSQGVAPLPQRRNLPPQPLSVDSICDWDSGEVQSPPTRLLRAHPPHPCHPQSLPGPLLPTRANAPPHPGSTPPQHHPLQALSSPWPVSVLTLVLLSLSGPVPSPYPIGLY